MKLAQTLLLVAFLVAGATARSDCKTVREIHHDRTFGCSPMGHAPSSVNLLATAWLSWNQDCSSPQTNLDPLPQGSRFLYVQLGGLDELFGCEFCVCWQPPLYWQSGPFEFKPPGQTDDPVWEEAVAGQGDNGAESYESSEEQGAGFCRVAYSGRVCGKGFELGTIVRIGFDFGCYPTTAPMSFALEYVKVTDCSARVAEIKITGGASTLGGIPDDTPLPITRTTWGALKRSF